MSNKLVTLICILAISSVYCDTTIMVIELFRHGVRYSVTPEVYNMGVYEGELSPTGMRQHYLLGRVLAEQYPDLGVPLTANNVYMRSTSFNRTLDSAYSHLLGFFRHTGPNITESQINFTNNIPFNTQNLKPGNLGLSALPYNIQPVPVHTRNTVNDFLLLPISSCPNSGIWEYGNYLTNEYLAQLGVDMNETLAYLNQTFPEIQEMINQGNLYWGAVEAVTDTIMDNYYSELPTPNNFDFEKYGYNISFLNGFLNVVEDFGTSNQVHIYSTYFLHTVYDMIQARISGQNNYSMVFYSAHQSNVISVVSAFGIVTPKCMVYEKAHPGTYPLCYPPGFASNVHFELIKTDSNDYKIKFYYNGTESNICHTLDGMCTLVEFRLLIELVTAGKTLKNYKQDCGVTLDSETSVNMELSTQRNITVEILLGVIGIELIVIFAYYNLIYKKNKKGEKNDQEKMLLVNSI